MASDYRKLTPTEKDVLKEQGCESENWANIEVKEGFNPRKITDCYFGGYVKMGKFDELVNFEGGVVLDAGISYAKIFNCTLGDNVYISNVRQYIANYHIGDKTVIENAGKICTEGISTFGNGVKAAVINEAGGREIIIFEELTSQIAYLQAIYRHRNKLQEKLTSIIEKFCKGIRSKTGYIGDGCRIKNCRTIRNVKLEDNCIVEGASLLENGTVKTDRNSETLIGSDVIARDFIIKDGAEVSDGAVIEKCFVGQVCKISGGFTAENSVFFANSEMLLGEACSVFAGPYTVTHHKSTLLIAGMFSFYNAGSGTNQSNHLYKSGPVHQGVLERGSKTGSESYLLWPSKAGPFSVVVGKHYRHFDLGEMPFSYIISRNGESIIVPGVNLRNVGTFRDSQKWKQRDKRTSSKEDIINFEIFNPFTVSKMIQAKKVIRQHLQEKTEEIFDFRGLKMRRSSAQNALKLYDTAINIFIGEVLLRKADSLTSDISFNESKASSEIKWCDIGGMIVSDEDIDNICSDIESEKTDEVPDLKAAFINIKKDTAKKWMGYGLLLLGDKLDKSVNNLRGKDFITALNDYKNALNTLQNLHISDAEKEFDDDKKISYGLDGDMQVKEKDFIAVRGDLEKNLLLKNIKQKYEKDIKDADKMIKRLKKKVK